MSIINKISDNIFKNMTNSYGFYISIIMFIAITLKAIINLNKLKEMTNFFKNSTTVIQLLIIAFWVFLVQNYTSRQEKNDKMSEKLKVATKRALIALLIAFFTKIDLVIAPFWLIWVIGYYLEEWI